MTPRYVTLIMLSLVILLSAGCAGRPMIAYEGPKVPEDKVATVYTMALIPAILRGKYTWVGAIDGKNVPRGKYSHIKLLPGSHTVGFTYEVTGPITGLLGLVVFYKEVGNIKFNAVSGHAYKVFSNISGDRLWSWVVDAATDKVIAGKKPP